MKKPIWVVWTVFLIIACSDGQKIQPILHSVQLIETEATGGASSKIYSGIIEEAHEINLGFKIPGQLLRVHVREGEYVRSGQLLAELDDKDYSLAVKATQIQYNQAKDEVARITQLYNDKSVSTNDYEKANSLLGQLGVKLQADRNKLSYTKLYAPTDGYIQLVSFAAAEMVDAGTPVCTLLDVSQMQVVADIPASQYVARGRFKGITCRTAYTGNEKIPLKLLNITPKADGNQLYQMRLQFSSATDRRITSGMNVEVCVHMSDTTHGKGCILPLESVFNDRGKSCVWVFSNDSTVKRRPVVLKGIDSEGRALIGEGVAEGERVVRAGVHALQDGEKVHVIATPSATNIGGLL